MADQTGKTCKVCKKDVSGARQCQQCKEFDKKKKDIGNNMWCQ